MGRTLSPWMIDERAREAERKAEAKAADVARGSLVFAVLPWRGDARYDGADVIRWFKTRGPAERYATDLLGYGGRGVVVRKWTDLRNANTTPRNRTAAELEREIREAIGRS